MAGDGVADPADQAVDEAVAAAVTTHALQAEAQAPAAPPPAALVGTTRATSLGSRRASKSGLVLISRDVENPVEEDARENHLRSQALLQQVLAHRGITTGTAAALVVQREAAPDEPADAEQQRLAYAKHIFNRLKVRGIHGIRTFRRLLHSMDQDLDGTCSARTVEGALTHLGIRMQAYEFAKLTELFHANSEDQELVDYVLLLAYGCTNWSQQREDVVREAFDVLSEQCPAGVLTSYIIETRFRSQALTSSHVPELDEHDSSKEFLAQWNGSCLGADGVVSWRDFADYYLDVSLCVDSEHEFCHYVCRSWGIDMDDWLAKKVFRRFADQDQPNVLPEAYFMRMLDELDPTITKEEARAWYTAIDQDESGEVSLDEFISSKVLTVKRLFDEFDPDHHRVVTEPVLVKILQSLNGAISDEEASQLYKHADLDNSGNISFSEFLVNGLLTYLRIFDELDADRGRSFNEAELKTLLRKLDPRVDDYDVQQCYKAIDTDGGGSISFVEFCESHVLRAKTLFDRYDTDRSRALTQFKFRELILDMDSSLTQPQMEAIYNLVADQNTGKVRLGGFLNPNVVKIKKLFDKYDQDRSGYLDVSEFKEMLKDLFKNATDKDVEQLVAAVCPPDQDQGITFTTYIQRFKELSRRHDILQLAKRREAREKAKSKGLVLKA
mmetsp:Transcript_66624/g.171478  ORF Transcript_66624/g.171478 Transcript_66624/m.171478 type:complete len:669 (+) Transcript_66624:1-2007(+)